MAAGRRPPGLQGWHGIALGMASALLGAHAAGSTRHEQGKQGANPCPERAPRLPCELCLRDAMGRSDDTGAGASWRCVPSYVVISMRAFLPLRSTCLRTLHPGNVHL